MFENNDTTTAYEKRSIVKPLLTMAIVLTVAWFAIVAITMTSQHSQLQSSGYGIDDIQTQTLIASNEIN